MIYVVMYLVAIVLANLSVAAFGPGVAIVNAFLFIGLDLTARDHLHDAWRGRRLLPKMAALIGAGSLLSWLLNREAGQIALASFVAFAAAGTVDAFVYHLLGSYPRWLRINGSNVPSALVDSLVFPTLAFGAFLWTIVLGQFLAKTTGGFVWSLFFRRLDRAGPPGREAGGAPQVPG
jgi:queuosine precursor transporter